MMLILLCVVSALESQERRNLLAHFTSDAALKATETKYYRRMRKNQIL